MKNFIKLYMGMTKKRKRETNEFLCLFALEEGVLNVIKFVNR